MNPILDTQAFDDLLERISEKVRDKKSQLEVLARKLEEEGSELQRLEASFMKVLGMKDRLTDVANELRQAVQDLETEEVASAQKTNFKRIEDFLLSRNNLSATIGEIEDGTQIGRSSISAVLYRTHAKEFIVNEKPGNQPNTWRLAGYEDTQNEGDKIPF